MSVALIAVGWDGFGIEASIWAVIIICVPLLLSFVMLVKRKDIAFCLGVMWALVGIQSSQIGYTSIVLASEIGIALLFVAIGVTVVSSMLKR